MSERPSSWKYYYGPCRNTGKVAEAMNYLEHPYHGGQALGVICVAPVIGAQTSRATPGIHNPTGEQQAYSQISGHPLMFSCL